MHQRSRLSLLVTLCVATLLSLLPPALPAAASEWPADGWVHAGPIEGGCQTAGSCSSTTDPLIAGLFEYRPDRTPVGPDEPPGGADHGGFPTYEKREQCWIEDSAGRYALEWAAGTWHHGAYWQRVNGRWYKSREHWAFFHKDECYRVAPGPTAAPPTPTTPPTVVPPPAPGTLSVSAAKCYAGGPPFATSISAWAGDWSDSRYASGVTFSVPGQHGAVSYSVDPQGWTVTGGDASGTVPTGSRVSLVLFNPAVCRQPTPNLPTSTPAPQPCAEIGTYDGSFVPLTVSGPGADVTSRLYAVNHGSQWTPPAEGPPLGTVQPGVPLAVTFDFGQLRGMSYSADHDGQARVRFGLTDLTTGQVLVNTDTEDEKELRDSADEVQVWGRSLRLSAVQLAGVAFSGTGVWRAWQRSWASWGPPSATPQLNTYYYDLGPSTLRFTPVAGHRYEAWAMAGHGPCSVAFVRWSRAQFVAGPLPTPTPDPSCADPGGCISMPPTPTPCPASGPCPTSVPPTAQPTPTVIPTPTPPPPPPPPAAQAELRLRLHGRHDPLSAWTERPQGRHADADAINTSADTTVSWPQGEILDWMPEITLQPLPAPPVDPWYGQLFEYRQEIVGWSFVGSRGVDARQGGCRDGGRVDPLLRGCAYLYLTSPTESDMRTMPHVLWFAGATPKELPADVYRYPLRKLAPVDLQVEIAVRVTVRNRMTNVETGVVQVLPAAFTVNLVTPRSVR